MFGAVTARSDAQVMRLACLYALLDCSVQIRVDHLRAGLEVWRYCEDSARSIFGDSLGDGTADAILEALRQNYLGMTRTGIYHLLDRKKPSEEITRAVLLLQGQGKVRCEREPPGGNQVQSPRRSFPDGRQQRDQIQSRT